MTGLKFHPLNNRGICYCTPSLIIPVLLGEWFFYKVRNGDNEPEKFLVLLGIYGIQDWFFVANWIWNFAAHSQLRFLKRTQSCLKQCTTNSAWKTAARVLRWLHFFRYETACCPSERNCLSLRRVQLAIPILGSIKQNIREHPFSLLKSHGTFKEMP